MGDDPEENREQVAEGLSGAFAIRFPLNSSFEAIREILADKLRMLIDQDPERLIFLLYRLDINENKVRALLAAGNPDTAMDLARLIMERQLQKIKTRNQFRKDDTARGEEIW